MTQALNAHSAIVPAVKLQPFRPFAARRPAVAAVSTFRLAERIDALLIGGADHPSAALADELEALVLVPLKTLRPMLARRMERELSILRKSAPMRTTVELALDDIRLVLLEDDS